MVGGAGHAGNLQRSRLVGQRHVQGFSEGNYGDGDQRHHQRQHWREDEESPVHVIGNHVFLEDELDSVSQRLQQAKRAHAGRSPAVLDAADDLALQPGGISHTGKQDEDHKRDLDNSGDEIVGSVHGVFVFMLLAASFWLVALFKPKQSSAPRSFTFRPVRQTEALFPVFKYQILSTKYRLKSAKRPDATALASSYPLVALSNFTACRAILHHGVQNLRIPPQRS